MWLSAVGVQLWPLFFIPLCYPNTMKHLFVCGWWFSTWLCSPLYSQTFIHSPPLDFSGRLSKLGMSSSGSASDSAVPLFFFFFFFFLFFCSGSPSLWPGYPTSLSLRLGPVSSGLSLTAGMCQIVHLHCDFFHPLVHFLLPVHPSFYSLFFSFCLLRAEVSAPQYQSVGHSGTDQSISGTGCFRGEAINHIITTSSLQCFSFPFIMFLLCTNKADISIIQHIFISFSFFSSSSIWILYNLKL